MIFWMSCSPIPPHVHPFPELHMTIPMILQEVRTRVPKSHHTDLKVKYRVDGWWEAKDNFKE